MRLRNKRIRQLEKIQQLGRSEPKTEIKNSIIMKIDYDWIDTDSYNVKRIVNHRWTLKNEMLYEVEWEGYSSEYNEWKEYMNEMCCDDKVIEYWNNPHHTSKYEKDRKKHLILLQRKKAAVAPSVKSPNNKSTKSSKQSTATSIKSKTVKRRKSLSAAETEVVSSRSTRSCRRSSILSPKPNSKRTIEEEESKGSKPIVRRLTKRAFSSIDNSTDFPLEEKRENNEKKKKEKEMSEENFDIPPILNSSTDNSEPINQDPPMPQVIEPINEDRIEENNADTMKVEKQQFNPSQSSIDIPIAKPATNQDATAVSSITTNPIVCEENHKEIETRSNMEMSTPGSSKLSTPIIKPNNMLRKSEPSGSTANRNQRLNHSAPKRKRISLPVPELESAKDVIFSRENLLKMLEEDRKRMELEASSPPQTSSFPYRPFR